jgi:hypothetical protein
MEYFVGSITTLAMIVLVNMLAKNKINNTISVVKYSQSSVFELIKPFVSDLIYTNPEDMNTQTMKYIKENIVRILFLEGMAYWIDGNRLMEAIASNGEIDYSTEIEVDTMNMNDVQLKRTMFIVEKLREGLNNDSGYPVNKEF